MKKFGRYYIYFRGSKKFVERTIYTENGKYFVKWYGEMVEVYTGTQHWKTVEMY